MGRARWSRKVTASGMGLDGTRLDWTGTYELQACWRLCDDSVLDGLVGDGTDVVL